MFCKNCGEKSDGVKNFCTNCGTAFSFHNEQKEKVSPNATYSDVENKINIKNTVWFIIILVIIGYNIYTSRDENAIETNNNAISNFDSGNTQQAITQLQDASTTAISNENRINSLKNLAYIYGTEGQNEQALATFQEAFKLANKNSVDYYLISAEIALLQGKPNSAYVSFKKAFEIDSEDFQTNNSLALFYLNLDGSSVDYEDYSKALTYALKADELSDLIMVKKTLAVVYYFNENYNQTISILNSIDISKDPFYKYYLGLAYAMKEDTVNAKIYLRQAIAGGIEVPQEVKDYINNN